MALWLWHCRRPAIERSDDAAAGIVMAELASTGSNRRDSDTAARSSLTEKLLGN